MGATLSVRGSWLCCQGRSNSDMRTRPTVKARARVWEGYSVACDGKQERRM